MRRIFLLVMGLLLMVTMFAVSAAGIAVAQEPLPDLVVTKDGPERVALDENNEAIVRHTIVVTNIGDATAPVASTTSPRLFLVRDETQVQGRFLGYGASGFSFSCPGQTKGEQDTFSAGAVICMSGYTTTDLLPGDSWSGWMQITMIGGGKVTNCATADPDNRVVESNEDNNTTCFTTKVTSGEGPPD